MRLQIELNGTPETLADAIVILKHGPALEIERIIVVHDLPPKPLADA